MIPSSLFPIPPTIPRTALITGGAKRLGQGIGTALARSGFSIAIHYRDSDDASEATADRFRGMGVQAITLPGDLSLEDDVKTLIPRATAALGPLGILVNNASTFERDEWNDATRESWDYHLEPNLRAPFVLMQDFAKQLPAIYNDAPAEGLIVNLLDQRVWNLTEHFITYTLSKAGLWTLTQTMALALSPRIRVNAIGPGPALPSPRQSQEQFDRQAASVPLRHGTSPEEIGRAMLAILTLPSLTGQMLALDGGQHLQWAPTKAQLGIAE